MPPLRRHVPPVRFGIALLTLATVAIAPWASARADALSQVIGFARTPVGEFVLRQTPEGLAALDRVFGRTMGRGIYAEDYAREIQALEGTLRGRAADPALVQLETRATRIRDRFAHEGAAAGPESAQARLARIAREELLRAEPTVGGRDPITFVSPQDVAQLDGYAQHALAWRASGASALEAAGDRLEQAIAAAHAARSAGGAAAVTSPATKRALQAALRELRGASLELARATLAANWEKRLAGATAPTATHALLECRELLARLEAQSAWLEVAAREAGLAVSGEEIAALSDDARLLADVRVAAGDGGPARLEDALQRRLLMTRHRAAVKLALQAHDEAGQLYGDQPYSTHLRAVRGALKRFGYGPKDSPAGLRYGTEAWLHDIIEDTPVTRDIIARKLDRRTADAVQALTNEPKRPGLSKEDRKRLTFERIAANDDARIVKLADRIANVEMSWRSRFTGQLSKLDKYLEEQPYFVRYLKKPGEAEAMWKHLERLLVDEAYARQTLGF